jgi:hypothetical protein
MSHPNPYLFQINRMDVKLVAEGMIQQVFVRTVEGCDGRSRLHLLCFGQVELCFYVRTHLVV